MRSGRSFGGELNAHPEGKQFHLATDKPYLITATSPTTRIFSSSIPTLVFKRGESVKLPTFSKPFSSLFPRKPHFRQNHHIPPSSNKGILPLPHYSPSPAQEFGWTTVVNSRDRDVSLGFSLALAFPLLRSAFSATSFLTWSRTAQRGTSSASSASSAMGRVTFPKTAPMAPDPSPRLQCFPSPPRPYRSSRNSHLSPSSIFQKTSLRSLNSERFPCRNS